MTAEQGGDVKLSEHIVYIAATILAGSAIWFQNVTSAIVFAALWLALAIRDLK